jgi:hypothetical protein
MAKFHPTNVESNVETLNLLSGHEFGIATEVQEFINKAIEAFPTMEDSFI